MTQVEIHSPKCLLLDLYVVEQSVPRFCPKAIYISYDGWLTVNEST